MNQKKAVLLQHETEIDTDSDVVGGDGRPDAGGDGNMDHRMARRTEYGEFEMVTDVANMCNIFATAAVLRMAVGKRS